MASRVVAIRRRVSVDIDIGMSVVVVWCGAVGCRYGCRDVASSSGLGLRGSLLGSCTFIQKGLKQPCVPVVSLVQKVGNVAKNGDKSTLKDSGKVREVRKRN